jgi:hypothetical protein
LRKCAIIFSCFGENLVKIRLKIDFDIAYINVEDVRKSSFSLIQFAEWLANGDIYFILSHPVQGISD